MRRTRRLVIMPLMFFLLLSVAVNASMSARSIGLGDDFVVVGGAEALYGNPALVNLEGKKFLLEFSATGGFWNNLFRNDYISEGDKDKLLDIAEKNGLLLGAEANPGLKMAIGPVLLFTEGRGQGLLRVSKDYAELLLKGNELERTYKLEGSNGVMAFYLDSGINYSHRLSDKQVESLNEAMNNDALQLDNCYVGISYHYLQGAFFKYEASGEFGLGFDEEGVGEITGSDGAVALYYTEIEEFADLARGHAFDIGVYADLNERYSLGFSILNIGGSMKVDRVREERLDFVYNEEKEEWELNDTSDQEFYLEKENIMQLPLIVKMGGKMEVIDGLDLLANYTISSYRDSIYKKGLTEHRWTLAAEFDRLQFLPLRAGLSYSTLESNLALSAGLGIHLGPLHLDLGVSDLTGLFYRSKGFNAGLNLSLVF